MDEEIKGLLEKNKQEHIIKLYENSNDDRKIQLLDQIKRMDFNEINKLYELTQISRDFKKISIEPIKACNANDLSDVEKERYVKLGIDAIKSGKLAVVMMAGRTRD